ncbi:hypothetical protein A2U01_0062941, partial [Trifolium medium]|nr:hypothetical protein [Trifolium medium]
SIATNAANTFTLGHCNLITAFCRALHVTEIKHQDEGQLPVKALTLKAFEGFGVPQGRGKSSRSAREEVDEEVEEMDQFERGVHSDQQQVPDAPPASSMPRYTNSINELAALLHNIE